MIDVTPNLPEVVAEVLGYGFDEIHAHRVARPPGPGTKDKRIRFPDLGWKVIAAHVSTMNAAS
jgi:hypothetical protein